MRLASHVAFLVLGDKSLENARVGVYSGKERDMIRILVGELEKSALL